MVDPEVPTPSEVWTALEPVGLLVLLEPVDLLVLPEPVDYLTAPEPVDCRILLQDAHFLLTGGA